MSGSHGPLAGLRIVEMTGIGPVPYAAMVLADLGAEIIRIDRPGGYPAIDPKIDFSAMEKASVFYRSRRLLRVDLRAEAGRELALRLVSRADALIEGYRPGVMERLGLGPAACHAANPKLAFVRVTGWGQDGPMARMAGHDMNYLGLSGALSLFARDGAPPVGIPPLLGDMAGGALFGVIGLLSAVMRARAGGPGQVVDANILDGSANLFALLSAMAAIGQHDPRAGGNLLDGGRHFYRTYVCADGEAVVVGAIEPAFRKVLLERLGLLDEPCFLSGDPDDEARCTARLAAIFAGAPRDHWVALFDGTDGCVTPVLRMDEAPDAPQNRARGVFAEIDGVVQPGPAPRFSATPGAVSRTPSEGSRSDPGALAGWGVGPEEIAAFLREGVIEGAS